jgi:hypothetical protein
LSTTVVVPVTQDPGTDMYWHPWLVLSVKEDDAKKKIEAALRRVAVNSIEDDESENGIDEIELRAALSSELRGEHLQLTELRVVDLAFLGND